MKIKVVDDEHHFTIPLPNGLIINGVTAKIVHRYIQKYTDINITEEQLKVLCCHLKEAKKILNNRPLVYVKGKNGEMVIITL